MSALPQIPPLPTAAGDVKACCAELYESDAARWLLGDELHPGGELSTLRLAENPCHSTWPGRSPGSDCEPCAAATSSAGAGMAKAKSPVPAMTSR